MSKFQHDVMLRAVKFLDVILMTLPFAENTVDSVIVGKSGDIIVRFMNAVEVRCGR